MQEPKVIYYTTADVARRLHVVPDRIRQLARTGRLTTAIVTRSGQRLFIEADVSRCEAERRRSDTAQQRRRYSCSDLTTATPTTTRTPSSIGSCADENDGLL